MTEYIRGFVIPAVADVHAKFAEAIKLAEEVDRLTVRGAGTRTLAAATAAQLRRAYVDFNAGLRTTAVKAADAASTGMIARFDSTRVRADSGATPHLRDLLHARPLAPYGGVETGAVGIADVGMLDRALNRNSPNYGTYWRAQEYGTGKDGVPSQVGRVIRGYFTAAGGGDPTPPLAEFGGGGGGPHPVFISGASGQQRTAGSGRGPGPAGGVGGFGTIGHEIRPRHFIKFGADEAAIQWRTGIARVQSQAIDQLTAIFK